MKYLLSFACLIALFSSCVRASEFNPYGIDSDSSVDPREYQIELNEDASITIYDGTRLVGTVQYDSLNVVCEMFINDNL